MSILRLIFHDLPSKGKIHLMAWLFFYCLFMNLSDGDDTLSANRSLSGDQTLVSSGEIFELGFFRPGNSSWYYYIGIWYKNISPQTVVWIANRDKPISDKYSSELKVTEDGNLVLLDESKMKIWSTNLNYTVLNSVIAVLLDNGNFALKEASDQNSVLPIWQSFDYPTNTFLPGSKISYSKRTKTEHFVTSWKNSEDPATGRFSFEFEPNDRQFVMKWNGSEEYWASGPWNGESFSALPETALHYLYNFSYISNENESSFTFSVNNPSTISRAVLDVSGQLQLLTWLERTQQWNIFWVQPKQLCEVYAVCGAFGTCSPSSSEICNCPIGFNPRTEGEWNLGDFSDGCIRKTNLACQTSITETSRNVRFLATGWNLRNRSSDQSVETAEYLPVAAREEPECKSMCVEDCSCNAYTYFSNLCWIWRGEIFDLVKPSEDGDVANERTVYLKVASSDIPPIPNSSFKNLATGIISSIAILVFLSLCSVALCSYRRRVRRDHENRTGCKENPILCIYQRPRRVVDSTEPWKRIKSDQKSIEIPFFEFETIAAATENFSNANKLGQGGFGPVYKGKLPDGLEIAVKRLSTSSGQGLEEFKNEVMLIAKLQHRNLVRLLGYCMEEEEMMLLYEYMPNKSLNHFIFDRTQCGLLDWSKRFTIILGIARGLLYLHQDSRLRIIHRDLKTSNILLDEDMNPKISDFGLAKIVQGTETEASTKRVMGTYGYMSPEYALDGLFSVKSDVFSFGVVVLEIISGKKNNGFYQSEEAPSLLGHAWNLWNEEKPLDLMDQVLVESCNSTDVLKCITLALLCIQEDPNVRPTMSNVVPMLSSNACLPRPKQPAFVARGGLCSSFSSLKVHVPHTQTNNQSTTSILEGR